MIVKELSLTVEEGGIYALIGNNGAGKSTTVRMMAGLENLIQEPLHIKKRTFLRIKAFITQNWGTCHRI